MYLLKYIEQHYDITTILIQKYIPQVVEGILQKKIYRKIFYHVYCYNFLSYIIDECNCDCLGLNFLPWFMVVIGSFALLSHNTLKWSAILELRFFA